jgi:hypothetical protein
MVEDCWLWIVLPPFRWAMTIARRSDTWWPYFEWASLSMLQRGIVRIVVDRVLTHSTDRDHCNRVNQRSIWGMWCTWLLERGPIWLRLFNCALYISLSTQYCALRELLQNFWAWEISTETWSASRALPDSDGQSGISLNALESRNMVVECKLLKTRASLVNR